MNRKIFFLGILVLAFSGTVPGWSELPSEFDNPLPEYAALLREEAAAFSTRLTGDAGTDEALIGDYRHWAEHRMKELLDRWEEAARERVSQDPFDRLPGETDRAGAALREQRFEYRRRLEQMTELFARGYLSPGSPSYPAGRAGLREEEEPALTIGEGKFFGADPFSESLEGPEDMLRLYAAGGDRLLPLSEWQKAEESLLEERERWETLVEQEYTRQLEDMSLEYGKILKREGEWDQNFTETGIADRQEWENLYSRFKESAGDSLAEFKTALQAEMEEVLGLQQRLSASLTASENMIFEAEKHIFLGEEAPYWEEVREENLELHAEAFGTMEALLGSFPGAAETMTENLLEEAEFRLELARQDRTFIEELIRYFSLAPEDRPAASELEELLARKGEEYQAARGLFTKGSVRGVAAYDSLLLTGRLLDFSNSWAELEDKTGRAVDIESLLLEDLRDRLDTADESCEALEQERNSLSSRLSAFIEEAERSRELVRFEASLEEEKKLRSTARVLEEAAERVRAKNALLDNEMKQVDLRIEREARELFPAEELGTSMALAEGLIGHMEEKQGANRGSSDVLKDFAFALYHKRGQSLDPGYISANQVYRKLKSKIGYSEAEALGGISLERYESVQADEQLRQLFDIYSGIMASTGPETSILHRAATEDLGEVLFSSILQRAGKKINSLKRERSVLLGQAAYYSGLAAVAYATFNIPGGVALTAVAVGFTVGAMEVKEKIDDISSLRISLAEQEMSGAEERDEIRSGLDRMVLLEDRRRQIGVEQALFATESLSADRWIEKLTGEDGRLRGLLGGAVREPGSGSDEAGELRQRLAEYAGALRDSYTLEEFLETLVGENSQLLRDRELRNRDIVEKAAGDARDGLYRNSFVDSEEDMEEFFRNALIVDMAGSQPTVTASGGLALSRLISGEILLRNASVRSALVEGRIEKRFNEWAGQKDFLYEEGKEVWKSVKGSLQASVSEWDLAFREKYAEDRQLWNQKSRLFQEYRDRSMRQMAGKEVREIVTRGIEELSLRPDLLAAEIAVSDIGTLPRWSSPVADPLDSPARREGSELFTFLGNEEGIASLLPEPAASRSALQSYRESIDGLYERAEKNLRTVSFDTGLREVERLVREHQGELRGAVDRANSRTAGSIHTTLEAAGYRKNGQLFQRKALVDLSVFQHERESQVIEGYRDFQMKDPDWDTQLAALTSRGGSAETQIHSYERLLREIVAQRRLIFGEYEGEGEDPAGLVSGSMRGRFEESLRSFQSGAGYGDHSDLKGLLAWHIGYSPLMDEKNPEKVKRNGEGELGRIMTSYFINEARLGRGLGMMDVASWDRRLWDDDRDNDGESDGPVRATTVRSLADLGAQAAASLVLGPGVGSILAGLGDELFFSLADVSAGYSSVEDAAFGVGKKALLQSALAGNSLLWGSAAPLPAGWSEGRGIFDGVLRGAGRTAGASLLSSSASAVDLQGRSLVWDEGRFIDTLAGRDSTFSLFSSLAGTLGSNLVEKSLFDREALYGFSSGDISEMRGSVYFGGELIGAAAEYAYTGGTSFNLAGIGSTGLLELHVEDGGLYWSAGSGGTRLSYERIHTLAAGLESQFLNRRIGAFAEKNFVDPDEQALAAQILRFQSSFGDGRSLETLEALLAGEREVAFVEGVPWRGNTVEGNTVEGNMVGGGDRPLVSLLYRDGGDLMSPASLALTLQHEGYRDGVVGEGNSLETLQAVRSHNTMAKKILLDDLYGYKALKGDRKLLVEMALLAEGESGEAQLRRLYDSSGDYWKMIEGGALMWDGSHHLWGEGGHLIARHERGSFSQSLADYMGIERDEALVLMENMGLVYDEGLGTYLYSGPPRAIPANPVLEAMYDMERRFYPDREGLIPVSGKSAYAWAAREHGYRLREGYRSEAYADTMERILSTPASFGGVTGLRVEDGFPGIRETVTLYRYSQQHLEEAVTGAPMDSSKGNGYCLAEAIAFNYVDRVEGVSWENLRDAFASAEWGGSFDPYSGYVGDKGEFTKRISRSLGLEDRAREYRFTSLEGVNDFLQTDPVGHENYHVVADYGSHFTHVRSDGLEVNSYPGWEAPAGGPDQWRVYLWGSR